MKDIFKKVIVSILTAEAALLLRRKKPTIIAVTGSVGKTTTKDAIFAAIKSDSHARKSEKSFNSEIGVPLTVLGLPNAWNNPVRWMFTIVDGLFTALFAQSYPAVLVLETGIDRPGDMDRLTKWLKPSIVVLTRLPEIPVHVEYFPTPEAVSEEKMKLVAALKADGVLVYNADDTIITSRLADVLQKTVGFSRYLDSDFIARGDKIVYRDDVPAGVECTVTHQESSYKLLIKDTVGAQHTYACGAAIAVASELGIPLENAVASLQTLRTPNGRMRILSAIKGSYIIDDTYNSSPTAAEHALQTLGEVKHAKRKIVVFGDMLELGKHSAESHRAIGALIPSVANKLLTVGVRARGFAEGALTAGMQEADILQYDDAARAGRELQALLQPGDVVLIKGSQGIRTERIVEEVMNEPERASELLVRQDTMWRKR